MSMTGRPTSRSAEIADLEERLSRALGRQKAAYARAAELRKELEQKHRALMEAVEAADARRPTHEEALARFEEARERGLPR